MRCREFERIWNERLDAAASVAAGSGSEARRAPSVDDRLEQHADSCPECRRLAASFAKLERALETKHSAPKPSLQLMGRVLNAVSRREYQPTRWQLLRAWIDGDRSLSANEFPKVMGAFAGVFAVVSLLVLLLPDPPKRVENPQTAWPRLTDNANTPVPSRETAPVFSRALETATEATWQLARTASEPAASFGRELFEAAIPDSLPAAPTPSVLPKSGSASLALERISDQLAHGARPLSTAARRAFGFLSLPSTEKHPERRGSVPANRPA